MAVTITNVSADYIYFRSRMGVAYVLAPSETITLAPDYYQAAASGQNAGDSMFSQGASMESNESGFGGVMIYNVGSKTLIFTPGPIIIAPRETKGLAPGKYDVSTK